MKKVRKAPLVFAIIILIVALAFGLFVFFMAYKTPQSKMSFDVKDPNLNVMIYIETSSGQKFEINTTASGISKNNIQIDNMLLTRQQPEQSIDFSFENQTSTPVKISFRNLPYDEAFPSDPRFSVDVEYSTTGSEDIIHYVYGSPVPEIIVPAYDEINSLASIMQVRLTYKIERPNLSFSINQDVEVVLENSL